MHARLLVTALMVVTTLISPAPSGASAQTETICKSSVGPGLTPPARVPSGITGFHASWYGQSGYPTLCPGEKSTATVAYYNSGSLGWVAGRMGQAAYLGTWGPEPGQDRLSPLGGERTGWPRDNRIAVQPAPYVGPGQVAWFQFTIQAPTTPGRYSLYLRPLIEGAAWLEDYGVFWMITVLNSDGTYAPPPSQPGCRAWPKELGNMLAKLSVSPDLCLLPYESRPEMCGPTLVGCYLGKARYYGGVDWPRNTVWVQSGLRLDAELHATSHETCHAHQHRVTIDLDGAGVYSGWEILSQEAEEFRVAWQAFKVNSPQAYAEFGDRGQDLENAAEVCASWYFPYGVRNIASYQPLANWAKKWLPK